MKRYFVDKGKIYEYAENKTDYTKEYLDSQVWIDKLNGREAYFLPEFDVTVVDGYYVHKDWCREFEVVK